jgi:hypothetical protein
MASGVIPPIGVIEPYKAGDTLTFSNTSGYFVLQTVAATQVRIYFAFSKPVLNGTTVRMYGDFVGKFGTNGSVSFSVGSSSNPVILTRCNDMGYYYYHSVSSNTFKAPCDGIACAGSSGVTIKFTT